MKQGVGLVMMRAALSKEMTDELKKIKGYLFDIDGVLLLGSEAIPGAKELLEELRQKGKHCSLYPTPVPGQEQRRAVCKRRDRD